MSIATVLPSRYLPPVEWFAAAWGHDEVTICTHCHYDKRDKGTHRCVIADANGQARLTVPIEKPASITATMLDEIVISAHDNWWNIHFTALASAYGRTPFFEYYADDLMPFYTRDWAGRRLTEYTGELTRLIGRLAGLSTHFIDGGGQLTSLPEINATEYYQVRRERFGFLPGMSIVDLLFNMGPESELILERMAKSKHTQGA